MTTFQKLIAVLIAGFLMVAVYDRVNKYRHEKAAAKSTASQTMWDGLHRCEDAIPYPIATGRTKQQHDEDMQVWIAAQNGCKKFWIEEK
jgi:hypothetical protein